MNSYGFDDVVTRLGSGCVKWDECPHEDLIPLWVADMDFKAAPAIMDALRRRVEHGVFGYTHVPEAYYRSVCNWFERRHGWKMDIDSIIYTSGVVPAISAIIKAVTLPGDSVLVHTPAYNAFFSSIRNCGCQAVESPLVGGPDYRMDFEDLERRLQEPRMRVMLLCNPHNPSGRVWTRDELLRVAELCHRYGVFVISDEIHCELMMPGYSYVPYGTMPAEYLDNCAICTSPSKNFNIAGLQIANITVPNPSWKERIDRAINIHEVCDVNPFGVEALMAAYDESEDWLDSLLEYLHGNYEMLCTFFRDRLPELKVTPLQGTYLVWVDCSALGLPSGELSRRLMESEHVWMNPGDMYHEYGGSFLRINIACRKALLAEGLERLESFVRSL